MAGTPGGQSEFVTERLVGRRTELHWLRNHLNLARDGYPHLVIVEGESGIGKTRMAQEALAEARLDGVVVLRGRCYEHLDLAYLPLRESLFAAMARILDAQPDRAADRHLLAQVRADVAVVDSAEPQTLESSHTRQLLTLTELVIDFVSTTATTLLFIDDLDWADQATTDLLRHLLFRLDDERAPLLVMATSRADPHTRAAAAVARLRSEPRTAVLYLQRLSPLEAAELARDIQPGTSIERARQLATASGGNPLLVEALSRYDQDEPGSSRISQIGRGPEHPVTEGVRTMLESLIGDARTVVSAVAVLAPECTPALVTMVCGLDASRVDAALRQGVAAGVLTFDGADIAFTHPLYSHLTDTGAVPADRQRLHALAAEAMARRRNRGEPVLLRSIAHHVINAGPDVRLPLPAGWLRQAGDEALALGAWGEAARCYEAALDNGAAGPSEATQLHRLAALGRRGNLQLPEAMAHLEAAIELAGPTADPAVLAELHIWRIRCAIGSHELLSTVTDRRPLEALIDVIERDHPQLAADALVQLSQSYWVDRKMRLATVAARRAMTIAERCDDHRTAALAAGVMCVPQWAHYELRESLTTLEAGVEHSRRSNDPSALAGGPFFRLPLVLAWLGRLDEAHASALECCEVAERRQYPLEVGLPLAALSLIALVRGQFDQVDQHAHRALLIQQLTGYHWAAGLFLPTLACSHVARGQFDAARDDLDTWGQTADAVEGATIELMTRWVKAAERGLAVQGGPLPGLPDQPMLGAEGWAAASVEIARLESEPEDVEAARRMLGAVDRRGGVFASGMGTLVPRVLGVAMDMLDDEEAEPTLRRAVATAERLHADVELARSRRDLALHLLRHSGTREAMDLLDTAGSAFQRLGMTAEGQRLDQILSVPIVQARRAARVSNLERSVVFFSDIVESTRLTEEMGSRHYRLQALQVEHAVTSAIVAHGGSIVSGISLGDGFIGLFTTVSKAIAAAQQCARDVPMTALHLHMGIHQGELIVDGSRIYGAAVNFAARVCALSGPDEVLISSPVYEAAPSSVREAFVDRGEHGLKGIAGLQRLYGLIQAGSGPALRG